MSTITIWTYDWVPEGPRGFVRDLRLRWACEEAGFSYLVNSVPFDGREINHLARQPFGQIPYLKRLSEEVTMLATATSRFSRAAPACCTSLVKKKR